MLVKDLFRDRVLTFSNLLTVTRILIVPYVIYCIYMQKISNEVLYTYAIAAGYVIIGLSDFFDGYLARLLNQISRLGQFLDPLADKIASLSILIALYVNNDYPLWVLCAVLLREAYVICAGLFLFYKRDIDVKPNIFGKLYVTALSFSAIVYTFNLEWEFAGYCIRDISIALIMFFYAAGFLLQIKKYSRYYFDR